MFEPKCPKCGTRAVIGRNMLMEFWYCPNCNERNMDRKRIMEMERRLEKLEQTMKKERGDAEA